MVTTTKTPNQHPAMSYGRQVQFLGVWIMLVVLGLLMRLWSVQFLSDQEYLSQAQQNFRRELILQPERGWIYDRQGRVLVDNLPTWDLVIDRTAITTRQREDGARKLAELLGKDPEQVIQMSRWGPRHASGFTTVLAGLSFQEHLLIEELHHYLPGMISVENWRRRYLYQDAACHLIGYIGPITPEQLEQRREIGYHLTDLVGQTGLESSLDRILKGQVGQKYQKVYATGLVAEQLPGGREPMPGQSVYLTIDIELQRAVEALLGRQQGAIVVVRPDTGEVLAMASSPRYNLNALAPGRTRAAFQQVMNQSGYPFVNRAMRAFQPGSVFKMVTMGAGMERANINVNTRYTCRGGMPVAGRLQKCWIYPRGHGTLALVEAFRRSCNVYFYNVGREVGLEELVAYSQACGFGHPTGLAELSDLPGSLPDPQWRTGLVHILNTAIGQGDVSVTPLQVAMFTAAIAHKGVMMTPQLVYRIVDADHRTVQPLIPEPRRMLPMSQNTLTTIQQAMSEVVHARQGATGFRAKIDGLAIAGKTGTSQVPGRPDHAWFTCYAGLPNAPPEFVVTVFLEHCGEHGGTISAPLAREVIVKYYEIMKGGLPVSVVQDPPVAARTAPAPRAPQAQRRSAPPPQSSPWRWRPQQEPPPRSTRWGWR